MPVLVQECLVRVLVLVLVPFAIDIYTFIYNSKVSQVRGIRFPYNHLKPKIPYGVYQIGLSTPSMSEYVVGHPQVNQFGV